MEAMGERPREQDVQDVAGATVGWDLKIAVCVPSVGTWDARTAESVANLALCFQQASYDGGTHEVRVFHATGSILTDNRHRLVALAAKWEATHILMLDSDMLVPLDTIQRMLMSNVPVIAANAVLRQWDTHPTAFKNGAYVYSRPEDTGLEEVDHVGAAVMLVDMRVFNALDLPYFHFESDPDDLPGVTGEDVYFCRKLRAAGVPIYIDHDLSKQVQHIGTMSYTMQHALQAEARRLDTAED
jgi:hypothetical protein